MTFCYNTMGEMRDNRREERQWKRRETVEEERVENQHQHYGEKDDGYSTRGSQQKRTERWKSEWKREKREEKEKRREEEDPKPYQTACHHPPLSPSSSLSRWGCSSLPTVIDPAPNMNIVSLEDNLAIHTN